MLAAYPEACNNAYFITAAGSATPGSVSRSGVGDFAWIDANQNGIQDPLEEGLPDVRVQLYDASWVLLNTTFTDRHGNYRFDNIIPGTRILRFTPPPGYRMTKSKEGRNISVDSDPSVQTGLVSLNLDPGNTDLSRDAGFVACRQCQPVNPMIY
jgi:hypothetical protein